MFVSKLNLYYTQKPEKYFDYVPKKYEQDYISPGAPATN